MKKLNLKRVFLLCVCCVGITACGANYNVWQLTSEDRNNLQAIGAEIPDNAVKIVRGSKGTGTPRTGTLPKRINGNPVVMLEKYLYVGGKFKKVTIPNSVVWIGEGAFRSNQLKNVTIPDSVIYIGDEAFRGNQLTSVTIGNGVKTIGKEAFAGDTYGEKGNQLTSVTFPNSVTYIGEKAFANNQLTSVVISDAVTEIGRYAFEENPIVSVTIPESVRNIGEYAFSQRELLREKKVEGTEGALATIVIGKDVNFAYNTFPINFNITYYDGKRRAGKYVVIRNGGKNRNGDLVDTWGRASN